MSNDTIFRGDNTAANGGQFITIEVENEYRVPFSKLVFSVNKGQILKEFTDEENHFTAENTELVVNFTSKETWKMQTENTGNLVTYDMDGLQQTCEEVCTWNTKDGVICNVCQC